MTYPETIRYLESFINYEKIPAYPYKESLKLERVRNFLTDIGNPQATLRCIHIAGTKGKGSTCAFIAYILRRAGYKVGLYTSPHLSDFRERIRIVIPDSEPRPTRRQTGIPNPEFEGMISKDELTELIERLKPAIEKYNKNSRYGPLSFFEVYTTLAFVYFKEKDVDFAVLETGLGGRLDATNVVSPYVCVITPISYEHTEKLGNTLEEIAQEKAGIIKPRCSELASRYPLIVISAPQEEEVWGIIRSRCQEVGAKLYEVNKDIFYEIQDDRFSIMGIFREYPCLKIMLIGRHQVINATVAVGAIEALRQYAVNIDIDMIRQGLYNTTWPGRCEIISENPLIVLDGAQNVASAKVLNETIKNNFKYKKLILVLGISQDKDIKGVCEELKDLADEVILTRSNNPRAAEPEKLAGYFDSKVAHITQNVKEAKTKALNIAGKGDLVLVTASLFVVGEFRRECPRRGLSLVCTSGIIK